MALDLVSIVSVHEVIQRILHSFLDLQLGAHYDSEFIRHRRLHLGLSTFT